MRRVTVALILMMTACGEAAEQPPSLPVEATTTTTMAVTTTAPTTTTTVAPTTTTTTVPTTTTLPPIEVSDELTALLDQAAGFPPCVDGAAGTGRVIDHVVETSPDSDIGVAELANMNFFGESGTFYGGGLLLSSNFPAISTEDDDTALAQAGLYYNHQRNLVTFTVFSNLLSQFDIARVDPTAAPRSADEWTEQVFTTWGNTQSDSATKIIVRTGSRTTSAPWSWRDVIRPPVTELDPSDAALSEAWDLIDGWITEVEEISNKTTLNYQWTAAFDELRPDLATMAGRAPDSLTR